MNDPDITIEEYVQLETEKALRNGKVYNCETATYGKIWYDEDVHYLRFFKTEFPAIVYNDALALNQISHLNLRNLTERKDEFGDAYFLESMLIIEQRVKVDQKARILELKQRNYKEHCYDNLYAVPIKEDTTPLCLKLHSSSTKNDLYAVSI
ncbi:hypothetical protein Tco_0109895 [Tanacetum coccineum]